ncbi:MAG: hypothetical protein VKI93_03950 [Synechococcus sp.]|nr:hypothetical protein [Synechococcus sp.]
MRKERCWVWFRGGLNEASRWIGGFQASTDELRGVLIQHPGYRDARVPAWRVTTEEPEDIHAVPEGLDEEGPWQFH